MIQLDISVALFIYLIFNVVGILLIWLFSGYRKKEMIFTKEEDYLWHCNICANIYIDSKDDIISKCPQCDSFNSRETGLSSK